jgi:putative DNA primase/helicase
MSKEEKGEYITNILYDIQTSHNINTIYNPKVGLYYYNKGIYIEDPKEGWLRYFIQNCHTGIDMKTLEEVVERIKTGSYKDFLEINKEKDIVTLNNCNYNLKTDKVEPFTPDIINTTRIAVNYDPNATCPVFDKYLKECTPERNIPIVEELFGFILSKSYEYKYMFIIQGGADSGKSTLIQLIGAILGGNICNIPPQTLVNNDFAVAELYGKLANTAGDISSTLIKDTSILKTLIGSDDMFGNKKYGGIITFKNYAKIIFACNTLPAVPDSELDLFLMKTILIKFPHTIPKHLQDHHLLEKLTTPEEMSGILNKALEGRRRLKKQNDFSNKLNKDEMLEEFSSNSDPVVRYIRDVIEISITEVTPKEYILKSFDDYCLLKKLPYPKAKNTFWKTFKTALPKEGIDYNRQIGSKGKSVYAIGGIRIRNLDEIELPEEIVPEPKIIVPTIINTDNEILNKTIPIKEFEGFDEILSYPEPEVLTEQELNLLNEAWEHKRLAIEEHEKYLESHPDHIKYKEQLAEHEKWLADQEKTLEEQ